MASTTANKEFISAHQPPASGVVSDKDDDNLSSQHSAKSETAGEISQLEAQGNAHFKRLGWKRLTVVLIVEAIALGSLSMPSAFATLGMVAGTILTILLGFIAIYTSYIVGQVSTTAIGELHTRASMS